MTKAAPFAVEFRTRSRRTKSGWTKWQHYIVAETRESAEQTVRNLVWWARDEEGELRIVDRRVLGAEKEKRAQ